jgi:uncharacterized RDD family membrane protein YckC
MSTEPPQRYAGLVTRAIAFALDAALIDAAALLVTAVVGLTISVLHLPSAARHVAIALGGVAFALWAIGYFAFFWATTGQTPADRLMRIAVLDSHGAARVPLRRALLRFGGMVLCAIPLGAGFLPMLVDARRRGLHDRLARTVVVHALLEPEASRA